MAIHSAFEIVLGSGSNDDADGFDPRIEGFVEKKGENGFCVARATDEGLKREMLVVGAGGRDHGFGDLHKVLPVCPIKLC
jgi:hypothetical protein